LFNSQVELTLNYFKESIEYKAYYLKNLSRVKFLLSKYNLDFDTTSYGCLSYSFFEDRKISFYYLQLLDTIDYVDSMQCIKNKKTFLEVGGGFGVNVHLLVELFGFKKIIYLDISPNLYVATQYLKSFYGDNVFNFSQIKEMKEIKFSDNDDLEIFCIPPQFIEKVKSKIDFFHNAHSFVEMPKNIVQNYANKITEILAKEGAIVSLVTYDKYDLKTTLEPSSLPNFFDYKHLDKNEFPSLVPGRKNFHYLLSQSK
jgi:putative sugar O-methyltransferase